MAIDAIFDLSRVGVPFMLCEYQVTGEHIRRYAEATNDPNPDFFEGRLAPPVFAVVPILKATVAAKNSVTPVFAFHGEQDIFFHQPITPGMILNATGTVIGIHQRSTGVATVVEAHTHTASGCLLNHQYFTSFVSGGRIPHSVGDEAPSRGPWREFVHEKPLLEVRYPLDVDQTRRFAAASDDWDAYAVDEKVARAMGFPTIMVHGMCTMAFSGRAVVNEICEGDARRLKRLAVRLSRPVFLVRGQSLTTRIWASERSDRTHYAFQALDCNGDTVINYGVAEIA